jgi:hypothetical protein
VHKLAEVVDVIRTASSVVGGRARDGRAALAAGSQHAEHRGFLGP